jgi:hypothetical protein
VHRTRAWYERNEVLPSFCSAIIVTRSFATRYTDGDTPSHDFTKANMPGNLDELVKQAHRALRPGSMFDIKRDFLTTTPISPPHGDTAKWTLQAKSNIPLEGGSVHGMDKAVKEALVPLGKMKAASDTFRSGFIKFRPVATNTDGQIGSLTFDVKYAKELKDAAARTGWLACWFLPWKSGHLLKMRLPDHGVALAAPTGGGLPPVNADIFFTAAINGCSVFVYGADNSPSVVHAGIGMNFADALSPTVMTALGGEGAAIWRNLLNGANVAGDGTVTTNPVKARANFAEVNRFDSVSQQKGTKIEQTTADSEGIEAYFARYRKDTLQGAIVNPWGCVCGIRSAGGSWTFILQRNVSVTYQRVMKSKGSFFSRSKITYGPTSQTSINIGYKIFYPLPGAVHMRDVASLTVT